MGYVAIYHGKCGLCNHMLWEVSQCWGLRPKAMYLFELAASCSSYPLSSDFFFLLLLCYFHCHFLMFHVWFYVQHLDF